MAFFFSSPFYSPVLYAEYLGWRAVNFFWRVSDDVMIDDTPYSCLIIARLLTTVKMQRLTLLSF